MVSDRNVSAKDLKRCRRAKRAGGSSPHDLTGGRDRVVAPRVCLRFASGPPRGRTTDVDSPNWLGLEPFVGSRSGVLPRPIEGPWSSHGSLDHAPSRVRRTVRPALTPVAVRRAGRCVSTTRGACTVVLRAGTSVGRFRMSEVKKVNFDLSCCRICQELLCT